jgi:tRNA nucleotidyltransferase/poly(A) polymerase
MSKIEKKIIKQLYGLITETEYSFDIKLPNDIYYLSKLFKKNGKKLFVVGGAVRDAKLGKVPKDFDLVTDALPDEVENILNSENIYNFPSGKNFGIISAVIGKETYEIATFRNDNYSEDFDGRRPSSVTFGDMEADAMRRDLTINALYYDIDRGVIVDLVGGLDDIENKKIKPVGNAISRFTEDRLRTLRALRFAHRFGSSLDKETIDAIIHFKDLPGVSNERIRDEFYKSLHSSKKPEDFVEQYLSLGLGPRTFGNVNLDTNHVPELRNPILVLAKLLWNNTPDSISKSLYSFKASKDEIEAVLFLKNIYERFVDFDKLVFDPLVDGYWLMGLIKKRDIFFEKNILNKRDVLTWGHIMKIDSNVLNQFVDFKITITAKDFSEIKPGRELGEKITIENSKLFLLGL